MIEQGSHLTMLKKLLLALYSRITYGVAQVAYEVTVIDPGSMK